MELEFIIQFPAHQPNLARGTRPGVRQMDVGLGLCGMAAETLPGIGVSICYDPW